MFWRKRENRSPELDGGQLGAAVTDEAQSADLAVEASETVTAGEPEPATKAAGEAVAVTGSDIALAQLEGRVIEAVSTVFDPEIPVNIYELGLIYDIRIDGMSDVKIDMTLTSPACPVAESLPGDVQRVVESVEGVRAVNVELVWEPQWSPDRMSEAARLELGFM